MIAYALLTPLTIFLFFWALFYRPLSGIAYVTKAAAKRASSAISGTSLGKRALAHARWPSVKAYAPIVVVLVVGVIAAITFSQLFIHLAHRVQITTSAVNRFDQTVWAFVGAARRPWLTAMFTAATNCGAAQGMIPIVVGVAGYLIYKKERASAFYVIGTAGFGDLLNLLLKANFERARPDLTAALAWSGSYSFPSGHSMSSIIVFGAVAYVAMREKWPWKLKSAALAGAVTMTILIGTSRVYLGVHWASDVAGAWTAGVVWLAATTVSFELLLRIRQRRRGERVSPPTVDVPDKPLPAVAG